MINRQINR